MQNRIWSIVAAALVAGSLVPAGIAAQSELDVAEAQEFLGDWNVTLQSEMGPLPLSLKIEDLEGKVAVVFESEQGTEEIENVLRNGDALVLSFVTDGQGQAIDVVINLQPEGEGLRTEINAMGGAFMASGLATRAP